jgi:hypothetical protein
MRVRLAALSFSAASRFACVALSFDNCQAQSLPNAADSQTGVMIVSLSPPVYPHVARTAYVYGDVNLLLPVKEDGKVDSAAVVRGSPLLRAAAPDSAQKSKFKYVGCGEAGGSHSVTYAFQLVETGACASNAPRDTDCQLEVQHAPNVIQSRNHVTIVAEAIGTCGPAIVVVKKVRSMKCRYLWRCGAKF